MPRKPGPKRGLTERLLANSSTIPAPKKPWRKLSQIARSRLKDARALWRRKNESEKYEKLARFIIGVREKLGMDRAQFAAKLEVSVLSVRRWELCYGYSPRPEIMDQIKKLGKST